MADLNNVERDVEHQSIINLRKQNVASDQGLQFSIHAAMFWTPQSAVKWTILGQVW